MRLGLLLAQFAVATLVIPVVSSSVVSQDDDRIESEKNVCAASASGSCSNSDNVSGQAADARVHDDVTQPQPQPHEPSKTANNKDNAKVLAKMYGVEQSLDGYDPSILFQVDEYFQNIVLKENKYSTIRDFCRNEDELCTYWASVGECDNNPGYMHLSCAPACRSCHKLMFEERCPFDLESARISDSLQQPGDLNKLFERITTDPYYEQYSPTVICKPGMVNPGRATTDGEDCPWIVTMDDFLTEHECETLMEQGGNLGYKRSEDVGKRKPDGSYDSVTSAGRTSTNAWCDEEECYQNATVQGVLQRLENLTGIPDVNSEHLQLLRYKVGQFYHTHHDYIPHDAQRAQGPRILTAFLYLNDVEAEGATHFTGLNISVYPKRGRVLLWPSVLDSDPNAMDGRTSHEAKPVEAGIKYAANSWIHLRNFKEPHEIGCA